jgi:pyruvate dehydrogenase E2 component (dihydrolipoamide acetyltransferase)
MYLLREGPAGPAKKRAARAAARQRHDPARGDRARGAAGADWGVPPTSGACTSFTELRRDGIECERWNLLHPTEKPRVPYVTQQLADAPGRSSPRPTTCGFAEQIRALRPGPPLHRVLGTDGFGRSDTRSKLRELLRGRPPLHRRTCARPGAQGSCAGRRPRPAPAPVAAPRWLPGPVEVVVPDIGDFKDVAVIEVLVKPGDTVKVEQSLITVESDKASMEIPSSHAAWSRRAVKLGDKVSQGQSCGGARARAGGRLPRRARWLRCAGRPAALPAGAAQPSPPARPKWARGRSRSTARHPAPTAARLALGAQVRARTGRAADEVQGQRAEGPDHAGGRAGASSRASWPAARGAGPCPGCAFRIGHRPGPAALAQVDFAKFGPIERKDLSRIKKISGANLHRNWVMIPHVTNHDDADITDLEAFRVQLNKENEKSGVKLTMLAFLIKACVAALKKFPTSTARSPDGDAIIRKNYWHIGFAADTPNGLVVPVIKDADKKGVFEIAQEIGELPPRRATASSARPTCRAEPSRSPRSAASAARYFTPIINAPEVAILGVCRAR